MKTLSFCVDVLFHLAAAWVNTPSCRKCYYQQSAFINTMLLAADQDHIGHLHHQAGNLIATQAAFAAIVQYTAGPKTQNPSVFPNGIAADIKCFSCICCVNVMVPQRFRQHFGWRPSCSHQPYRAAIAPIPCACRQHRSEVM